MVSGRVCPSSVEVSPTGQDDVPIYLLPSETLGMLLGAPENICINSPGIKLGERSEGGLPHNYSNVHCRCVCEDGWLRCKLSTLTSDQGSRGITKKDPLL